MNWKDSGPSTKSDSEINCLVDEVLLDPDFNLKDLRGFRAARENHRTDMADENSPFLDLFQTATIEIEVPSGSKEVPPAKFSIPWTALSQNTCCHTSHVCVASCIKISLIALQIISHGSKW